MSVSFGLVSVPVLLRLLLDPHDTAVTQETAEALLARGDTLGLRYVLLAMSRATVDSTLDELSAAVDCIPDWMTDDGADRLIEHLGERDGRRRRCPRRGSRDP